MKSTNTKKPKKDEKPDKVTVEMLKQTIADLAGTEEASGDQTNGDGATQGDSTTGLTGGSDTAVAEFEKTFK